MQSLQTIRIERSEGVAFVTFDRIRKHNVISELMREELVAAFDHFARDDETRVIVLTGGGDRSFCAGTDVEEFLGRPPAEQWRRDVSPARLFEVIERCPKPTIAMINGYAFGGGCEIALACDVRICGDKAELGLLEINFGLFPGGGGTQRLARLVGRGQAMRLVLSGDRIDASEAFRIGLVELLCAQDELRATTEDFARRLARHDPMALQFAKASIVAADEMPLSSGLRYEASLMALVMQAGGQEERISSFVNKSRTGKRPR